MTALFKFVSRFTDGNSTRDKLVILTQSILYILLYPVNRLSFLMVKRNIAHPRSLFNTFTVRNSDGLFVCRDNVDHDIVSESFESDLRKFFKEFKKGVFVDIGSNIGKYTVMIGNQLEAGRIVSIEAHPGNFGILKKNIELNRCKEVTAVNVACWNKKDEIKLYDHEDQPLVSSAIKKSKNYVTVKSDTLDGILNRLKTRYVDMVKIDVEGAEPQVLEGMENLLKTSKPKIIFEVLSDKSLDSCKNILEKHGYKTRRLSNTYYMGAST